VVENLEDVEVCLYNFSAKGLPSGAAAAEHYLVINFDDKTKVYTTEAAIGSDPTWEFEVMFGHRLSRHCRGRTLLIQCFQKTPAQADPLIGESSLQSIGFGHSNVVMQLAPGADAPLDRRFVSLSFVCDIGARLFESATAGCSQSDEAKAVKPCLQEAWCALYAESEEFRVKLGDIPLPSSWLRETSRNGRNFFSDSRAKKSTWQDPRLLPNGWEQRLDVSSGELYFSHAPSLQTTFQDPRGCPEGWEMHMATDGGCYFTYKGPAHQTYVDPRGLPSACAARLNANSKLYFKTSHDQTTSWVDPRRGAPEATRVQWLMDQLVSWLREEVDAVM